LLVLVQRSKAACFALSFLVASGSNNKKIIVNFQCADLAKEAHLPIMAKSDLVTAAAFFDLTSDSWLKKFSMALSKPLYATLSYNGAETWDPQGPDDQAVLKAFHFHQRTDKGFGAASGPNAANILINLNWKKL
jgi:hypothetical protein